MLLLATLSDGAPNSGRFRGRATITLAILSFREGRDALLARTLLHLTDMRAKKSQRSPESGISTALARPKGMKGMNCMYKRACILAAAAGTAWNVLAPTLYVDYVGGSDAAAGTSTSIAWQHCPGDSRPVLH
jgi:hypothetical protein